MIEDARLDVEGHSTGKFILVCKNVCERSRMRPLMIPLGAAGRRYGRHLDQRHGRPGLLPDPSVGIHFIEGPAPHLSEAVMLGLYPHLPQDRQGILIGRHGLDRMPLGDGRIAEKLPRQIEVRLVGVKSGPGPAAIDHAMYTSGRCLKNGVGLAQKIRQGRDLLSLPGAIIVHVQVHVHLSGHYSVAQGVDGNIHGGTAQIVDRADVLRQHHPDDPPRGAAPQSSPVLIGHSPPLNETCILPRIGISGRLTNLESEPQSPDVNGLSRFMAKLTPGVLVLYGVQVRP